MLALLASRLDKLSSIEQKIAFFITLPEYEAELFINKKNKVTLENAPEILREALFVLEAQNEYDNDSLYSSLVSLAEKLGIKSGTLMWCIRIAVSGMAVTPGGATEIMEVIGKDETVSRIKKALTKF
jgi:glutamyl-tRNA synthetase